MPTSSKKVSIVITATEHLSAAARKGARAVVELGKKGKAGLSRVERYAKRARDQLKRMLPSMNAIKRAAKALVAGMLIVGVTALAMAVKATKAWSVQEDAIVNVESAMRSVGNYTPELSKRYQELASSLQKVTTVGDEEILPVIANLTRIGKVNESQMADSAEAVLNLAQAMGTDLKSAAIVVGRAAAGETSMLKRYGVMVDEAALKAGGFEAVLKALNDQFGGTARAKTLTLAGAYKQLTNKIGDAWELLGKKLAPALRVLIKCLNPVIDRIADWIENSEDLNIIIFETIKILSRLAQWALRAGWGFLNMMMAISVLKNAFHLISDKTHAENMKKLTEMEGAIITLSIEMDKFSKEAGEAVMGGLFKRMPKRSPGVNLDDFVGTDELEAGAEAANKLVEALDKITADERSREMKELVDLLTYIAPAMEPANERFKATNEILEHQREIINRLQPEYQALAAMAKEVAVDVGAAVRNILGSSLGIIGNFIADVVAGVEGAGKAMAASLLASIGEMAISLGRYLIMAGTAIEALKKLGGWQAIGLGIALIALGGILKGLSKKLAAPSAGVGAGGAGAGGGGASAGYGAYRPSGYSAGQTAAVGPRYFFIDSGGQMREGARREADDYLERNLQAPTRRTIERMNRTDELALNRG